MDEQQLSGKIQQYMKLKEQKVHLEQQLKEIRDQLVAYCHERKKTEMKSGAYRVKLVLQQRREYDDRKLYEALSDADVWRMLSRADPAKIASLVKLNVLSEQTLEGTYTLKPVTKLLVDRFG